MLRCGADPRAISRHSMLALPVNASPFCKNLDSNDAGMAQTLKAAGISSSAFGIGAVAM